MSGDDVGGDHMVIFPTASSQITLVSPGGGRLLMTLQTSDLLSIRIELVDTFGHSHSCIICPLIQAIQTFSGLLISA